jgi:hypothetical protein
MAIYFTFSLSKDSVAIYTITGTIMQTGFNEMKDAISGIIVA